MILALTGPQIDAMAPDEPTATAGRALAQAPQWSRLGYNDEVLWGYCQGSGKVAYQTMVELDGYAYSCSCPSRKQPCKHVLGLMHLALSQPDSLSKEPSPEWVCTWQNRRKEQVERRQTRSKSKDKPVDVQAQAKRRAERHQRVLDGLDELQRWMRDILRSGLRQLPSPLWIVLEHLAKRLIDAQAPGLALMLRRLKALDTEVEGWQAELLDALSLIYILCESYRNIDALEPDWQDELRSLLGFPQSKAEVLARSPVEDDWVVLHTSTIEVEHLLRPAQWLYGLRSGRIARYVLEITRREQPESESSLTLGGLYSGTVYYYPGVLPQRVLPGDLQHIGPATLPKGYGNISSAHQHYRQQIAINPFLPFVPLLVEDLHLVRRSECWGLVDTEGYFVPIYYNERAIVYTLALAGASSMRVFALADPKRWRVCAIWSGEHYYPWDSNKKSDE